MGFGTNSFEGEIFIEASTPPDETYLLNPAHDVIDVACGHNTVVALTEKGTAMSVGSRLLAPSCVGQSRAIPHSGARMNLDMLAVEGLQDKYLFVVCWVDG